MATKLTYFRIETRSMITTGSPHPGHFQPPDQCLCVRCQHHAIDASSGEILNQLDLDRVIFLEGPFQMISLAFGHELLLGFLGPCTMERWEFVRCPFRDDRNLKGVIFDCLGGAASAQPTG